MDYTSLIKEVNIPELVKALRLCQFGECGCGKCRYKELKGDWCTEDNHPEFFDCDDKLKLDAADAIEALLSFAHYVADKVTMSDEDWEDYHEAFTEVACRKLAKLGVISIENGMYCYGRNESPQEEL